MTYKVKKGTEGILFTVRREDGVAVIDREDWIIRQALTFEEKCVIIKPGQSRGKNVPKFALEMAKEKMFVFRQPKPAKDDTFYFLAVSEREVS